MAFPSQPFDPGMASSLTNARIRLSQKRGESSSCSGATTLCANTGLQGTLQEQETPEVIDDRPLVCKKDVWLNMRSK